jgi:hypothetical protein
MRGYRPRGWAIRIVGRRPLPHSPISGSLTARRNGVPTLIDANRHHALSLRQSRDVPAGVTKFAAVEEVAH